MADIFHQFAVANLFNLSIFGFDISLTNSSLMMIVALLLILSVFSLTMLFFYHQKDWIQNKQQPYNTQSNAFLSILPRLVFFSYYKLRSLASQTQAICPNHFSVVLTVFFMILTGNLLGMIPGFFTFTSQIINNVVLSLFVIISTLAISIQHHGWQFFRLFCPSGLPIAVQVVIVPIEIVSFFFRIVSLSVRLFANMLAGHCILKIFASFSELVGPFFIVPLAFTVIMTVVEIGVAFLQAGIFALLSAEYIKQGIELH